MAFLQDGLVAIQPSAFGKGLFAVKKLKPGTVVCSINGPELTFADTLKLGLKESHSLQLGIDKYILCDPPFLFSNHSCDPNCAVNSSLLFYTLIEIEAGKELFWDYSTSMMERHWTMNCNCGTALCRKKITDFDLLPINIQLKYVKMKIVFPFITEELKKKKQEIKSFASF